MATISSTASKSKYTSVAKEVTDRFNASWSLAKSHHNRWKRNYQLYNNQRVMRGYEGITDTFVPMVFSIVETLTAALAAGRPSIDFVPQDMYKYVLTYVASGSKPDLRALNARFDYYWDCDNWDLKSIKTIRAGFNLGTSCEWVYWDGDRPRIINLNVRDAIIDPKLTDPMQLWSNPDDYFSGRRYLTTLDALKSEQIVDPETGVLKKRYNHLDKVQPGTTGDEALDKELKESMFLGANREDAKDLVEVIEIWDGKRIRSVANRTVDIEDRENTLGIHCLVIHRFIADESIIYGKAITDVIAKPQEYLNDLSNQRMDAVTDVLLPERELSPTYEDYLPLVESGSPGTVYPFEPGSMRFIDKPTVDASSFTESATIKNEIREATGADQIVQGIQAQGDATATEIQAQLNQAGQRIELYVRMLEREGFYQRAKIVYRMMQEYITEPTLTPVITQDGPKFRRYDPAQFNDDLEPKIQLEARVRSSEVRDARQAAEQYEILIADPTNDLWEAKKILYPKMFKLSEEELDRIIGQQKPMEGPLEGDPMAGDPTVDPGLDPGLEQQAEQSDPLELVI